LLETTIYQGNHDGNAKLWNIASTERYILYIQELLVQKVTRITEGNHDFCILPFLHIAFGQGVVKFKCYGVRYDFHIKAMFGSSLPPVVCMFLCLFAYCGFQSLLTMRVTWRCLIRSRNCLPFAGAFVHPRLWWGPCSSSFLFSVWYFLFGLSSSGVLCTQCCQFLWIVHFICTLRVSLTFVCNSSLNIIC
jgi:hypothetical protein